MEDFKARYDQELEYRFLFVRKCIEIATEDTSANKRLHKLQEILSREMLELVAPPRVSRLYSAERQQSDSQ